MTDWLPYAIAPVAVTLIAALKGAFGGGFALLGIPLLAMGMDPIAAGALLAPLLLLMDGFALRYWKPDTWSKPDLMALLPGLPLGVALGTVMIAYTPARAVEGAMALVSLGFAAKWYLSGGQVTLRARSGPLALLAGTASGLTTMIAHSGGPPLALYLLPLGLSKALYAGTTSLFFTLGNVIKVGPWLWAATPDAAGWVLMAACAPLCPLGVWLGYRLHQSLDQQQLYRWCYGLLVATGLLLGWRAVVG